MRKFLPFILLCIVLMACVGRNHYSRFHEIGSDGWGYYRQLPFILELDDSVATGRLDVTICHSNDYPYSNLYVQLDTELPNGHVRTDTINIALADVYGNWLGSGTGTSFQRTVTIFPSITLADSAHLRLRHVMRIDPVPAVEKIGLFFIENE